jgi:hypothetical protein
MRTLILEDYPFIFSEQLPARLSLLAKHFTLVWATAWEHGANQLLAPVLGLPDLPVISFAGPVARPGRTWKLSAVTRFVARQPMAWVDDELGRDAHTWAQKRAQPTLLLDINPSWGLAQAHVNALVAFVEQLASNPEAGAGG